MKYYTGTSLTLISSWILSSTTISVEGFTTAPSFFHNGRSIVPAVQRQSSTNVNSSANSNVDGLSPEEVQWNLFNKYHARGDWRGTWTTYNFMGDTTDTTTGSVNLNANEDGNMVNHEHEIVMGSVKSDCENCFDSMETKIFPVTAYTPENLLGRHRCASCAMVSGPSLLRSGAMSTELVLAFGDGRVRVTYLHAPVWEADGDEDSDPQQRGPPDGLKLFRVMLAREALRDAPPAPGRETDVKPGNPIFYRPVPPFKWHNEWAGTTWTWGPQAGDRGWAIEEMDEADSWHGRPTGDNQNVWSLRLGTILLQCPRVVLPNTVDFCRLAWLPEDESDDVNASLLRIEAGIVAMEPVIDEEEDVLVGFMPPKLSNLRCDVMTKTGELQNASMLEQLKKLGELKDNTVQKKKSPAPAAPKPISNKEKELKVEPASSPASKSKLFPSKSNDDDDEEEDEEDKIRNMISL